MRVVIDTNVIISGLYDPASMPGRILDAGIAGKLMLCAPESVRVELKRVLARVLGFTPPETWEALQSLKIEWIPASIYAPGLEAAKAMVRDEDDAPVLACGLILGCDIVSGDKDLQVVQSSKIRIWTPAELERQR